MSYRFHRFSSALYLAQELHWRQDRKGSGVPYIAHLLGVASLVMEAGGDEDEAIAALLHDAVEDQGGRATLERIGDRFGDRVADIVLGCSDSIDGEPKLKWRGCKEQYLEHLREASDSVRLVAMADKLYNLRAIVADYRQVGDELWSRFAGKKDGVLWYYRELGKVFGDGHPLAQEFGRSHDELLRLVQTGEDSRWWIGPRPD